MFVLIAGSIIGPAMAGPTGPFATALLFNDWIWPQGSRGLKARLCVLQYAEELFATVCAVKHGCNALNMRNAFRKIPRMEGDVAEEGQWRRVVELRLRFIIAL